MAQFPEDVKLTRDALALLGYIASTEPLGRTFLTTHGLYREVVAGLQRHATDNVVAVSIFLRSSSPVLLLQPMKYLHSQLGNFEEDAEVNRQFFSRTLVQIVRQPPLSHLSLPPVPTNQTGINMPA